MAVTAVSADDVVILAKSGTGARCDGLLTQIGVKIADYQALAVKFYAFGFEDSNGVERSIELLQELTGIGFHSSLPINSTVVICPFAQLNALR